MTARAPRATLGRDPALWLAAGLGAGLAPVAPGTVGTLVGVILWWFMRDLSPWIYGGLTLALIAIGIVLCERAVRRWKVNDHPAIVWDEIVGFLVTMFMAPAGGSWVVLGFLLFRLFDITKPYPVRQLERLPGGLGVVLDDVMAGIYAAAVLQGVAWAMTR